jgi:hypothetical protein
MATQEEMSRYFWSALTNCLPVVPGPFRIAAFSKKGNEVDVFELLLHTRAVNARISNRNKTHKRNFSTKFIVEFCFLYMCLGSKKI